MRSTHRLRLVLAGAVLALGACFASTGNPPPATYAGPNDPSAAQRSHERPPPPPPPAPRPPIETATPSPPPPAAPMPPAPPPLDERRDDRRDRIFDRSSDWDKLGERKVDGKRDRDVIKVGKKDGRFRAIAIVVEQSDVELYDVIVTFGDGTSFSPPTRLTFAEDSRSRVIDLPGDARVIRKVEFRYGNLAGGGKAQVELWGFDARNDDGDDRDGGRRKKR